MKIEEYYIVVWWNSLNIILEIAYANSLR
jgi:hypothetical protein